MSVTKLVRFICQTCGKEYFCQEDLELHEEGNEDLLLQVNDELDVLYKEGTEINIICQYCDKFESNDEIIMKQHIRKLHWKNTD